MLISYLIVGVIVFLTMLSLGEMAAFMPIAGSFCTFAGKFVDDAFAFFADLSDERIVHRPCKHPAWKALNLRCINFRKKYIVSYLDNKNEIIVCEFALQKNLK